VSALTPTLPMKRFFSSIGTNTALRMPWRSNRRRSFIACCGRSSRDVNAIASPC
jgi:hypothetical protein